MVSYIALLYLLKTVVVVGDFYAGVFNRNDFLVAQDHLYKERVPFRAVQSMYGRYFKCPITYFRVMDRLGMGRSPRVMVTRGGLGQRFLTLRITAQYNLPTSVTILVGCENKKKFSTTTKAPTVAPEASSTEPSNVTTVAPDNSTSPPNTGQGALGNATIAPSTVPTAPANATDPQGNTTLPDPGTTNAG